MTLTSLRPRFSRRGCFYLFVLAFTAAGCSSSGNKAKLTGKVFIGSEPLDGGTVVFLPVAEIDGGGGNGPVDDDGNYTATVTKPGKMKVYISLPTQPPKIPAGRSIGPPKDTKVPENVTTTLPKPKKSNVTVPLKYTDPNTTDYIITIEPGSHDLNLEFKK
jgi:hypothetical protein